MLFSDYKKKIISSYHEKKERGLLSHNLEKPTPAKLRDECLIVFSTRYLKKDDKTLRLFFNSGNESSDYRDSIKRFDPDRLRPLVTFLRNNSIGTDDRNIELLAWLIDFDERPYAFVPGNQIQDIKEFEQGPNNVENVNKIPTGSSYPVNTLGLAEKHWGVSLSGRTSVIKYSSISIIASIAIFMGISYIGTTTAYICKAGVGKKYHLNANCPALKNCKNESIETTVDAAKKNGKTLC